MPSVRGTKRETFIRQDVKKLELDSKNSTKAGLEPTTFGDLVDGPES
jgi:hypothetical protein